MEVSSIVKNYRVVLQSTSASCFRLASAHGVEAVRGVEVSSIVKNYRVVLESVRYFSGFTYSP